MTDRKKIERLEQRAAELERRAEEIEKINADVRERLIYLINTQVVSGRSRYDYLEERYGIPARKWKNVCNKVQMPGINMLSSILEDYPYFSTWLMLGKVVNTMQLDPTVKGWERQVTEALFQAITKHQATN